MHNRFVPIQALRNPNLTATQIISELLNVHQVNVSAQTVRNRLYADTLHARRPVRAPVLTRRNRGRRLE